MVVKNLATALRSSCQQMKSVNSTTTKTKSCVSISIYLLLVFMRYFVKWKCNCVMYASQAMASSHDCSFLPWKQGPLHGTSVYLIWIFAKYEDVSKGNGF